MKNKLLFSMMIFLISNVVNLLASNKQILNELNPVKITTSSDKGSIYIKVSKSSVYLLNLTKKEDLKTVFVVYDLSNKKYVTKKVYGSSVELKLKKDILYALIYIVAPNENIGFSLSDLDLSILNELTSKTIVSAIKKGNNKFIVSDLENLHLGVKLKKYILRVYKNNIYIVYQLFDNDDIKMSGYVKNIGWFNINNKVNGNVNDVEDFDFIINSKGEFYISFVTKENTNFNSELMVKKFNGRNWIDISPEYVQNVGPLVNIRINKDNKLYVSYLAKKNGEYKVILIENEGLGTVWENIANSYITNGDANVNASNIGLMADPFLGLFYNYKLNSDIKSEFIINRGKYWENTNTQSTYMASSIKILFDSLKNEILIGYISSNRPVLTSNLFLENKWRNLTPNIDSDSISRLDFKKYKNFLFLALEDSSSVKLIYYKNDYWYYFSDIEIFKANSSMPQLKNYSNKLLISYFNTDIKSLSFKIIH